MGAQRPDLFSYSRLWRLNRQKKKKDLCSYARVSRPF